MPFVVRCVLVGVTYALEWLSANQRIQIGTVLLRLPARSHSDDALESVLVQGRFKNKDGSTGRNRERGIMKTIGRSYGRVD